MIQFLPIHSKESLYLLSLYFTLLPLANLKFSLIIPQAFKVPPYIEILNLFVFMIQVCLNHTFFIICLVYDVISIFNSIKLQINLILHNF